MKRNKVVLISIPKLILLCGNPLRNPPWEEIKSEIIQEEVVEKIKQGKFPTEVAEYNPYSPLTRGAHVSRIAYLVVNGWEKCIEIWFNNKGFYQILDGSHRFAAAIIRRDEWIMANWSGDREQLRGVIYE